MYAYLKSRQEQRIFVKKENGPHPYYEGEGMRIHHYQRQFTLWNIKGERCWAGTYSNEQCSFPMKAINPNPKDVVNLHWIGNTCRLLSSNKGTIQGYFGLKVLSLSHSALRS